MADSLIKDRAVSVSIDKEAAFGTYEAPTRKLETLENWAPTNIQQRRHLNGTLTTGIENASVARAGTIHYVGTLPYGRIHADDLAWAQSYGFAAPTTTDLTSEYIHEFKVLSASDLSLNSFSVTEAIAAAEQQGYAGCLVQSWQVDKQVGTPATQRVEYVAKTRSDETEDPAASSEPVWLDGPVAINLGATVDSGFTGMTQGSTDLTATPADYQGQARDISFGMTNFSSPDHLFTFAGTTFARAERMIRTYNLSFTIEFDAADEALIREIVGTSTNQVLATRAVEIEWDSGIVVNSAVNYGAKFIWSKVLLTTGIARPDSASGKLLLPVTCEVLYDTGDYGLSEDFGVMRSGVWNGVAAYAT